VTLFYGQDLFTLLELDPNERFVSIPQICELFGIPAALYIQQAQVHIVLREGLETFEVEFDDGHVEDHLCIRIDLLPLWLSTIEANSVNPRFRLQLELFQREVASSLWQGFRPQGFGPLDTLVPDRLDQNPAEQAYVASLAMATLARHQMLIERHLDSHLNVSANLSTADGSSDGGDDPQAILLARAVRRVALAAQERTRRNEYPGMYTGLYRQFGISSYRHTPPARLHEALEWLERWRGDLMGEPEPPPDI
jgi:P22_AR N-terminal domain